MNKNNKSRKTISAIISAANFVLVVVMFILERLIDLYPDVIREKFGDNFMEWLIGLPLSSLIVIFVVLFVFALGYFLWMGNLIEEKAVKESDSLLESEQTIRDNGVGFQGIFNAPITIEKSDGSKKKDERERLSKERVVFHRLSYQFQILIDDGSSLDRVLQYVKNDIEAGAWHIFTPDKKYLYVVNPKRSFFYSPDIDNVVVDGVKFDVDKSSVTWKKSGGSSTKANSKIPDFFEMSFIQSGTTSSPRITIYFDTHHKDACLFFDRVKERLEEVFDGLVIKRDKKCVNI